MDVGVDAYATADDVSAYLSARGLDASWTTATEAQQEAAIIEATSFLDANFSWIGQIADCAQTLGWPRICVRDKEGRVLTGIPVQVVNATAELANLALGGRLAPMALGEEASIISERIGDVQIDYEAGGTEQSYDYVTLLLRGLCINNNAKKLVRA